MQCPNCDEEIEESQLVEKEIEYLEKAGRYHGPPEDCYPDEHGVYTVKCCEHCREDATLPEPDGDPGDPGDEPDDWRY